VAGWQISGVTIIQSGSLVNVTFAADRANIGIAGLQRPNLVGLVSSLNCQPNTAGTTDLARRELINCYDPSAFALPDQFTFGNTTRNVLRGPKFSQTDLSLMKNVPFGSGVRLQVRLEIYNLFNQVNYLNPGASFGAASFGRITAANPMRQIQIGAKLMF
jgi:hypothetical protein